MLRFATRNEENVTVAKVSTTPRLYEMRKLCQLSRNAIADPKASPTMPVMTRTSRNATPRPSSAPTAADPRL